MKNINLLLLNFFTLYKNTLNSLSNLKPYLNQKTFTNTLKDSDIFKDLKADIRDEKLVISIYDYWEDIENGRAKGVTPVSLSVLIDWIKRKNIKPYNNISINQLAFLIQRGIYRDGIKGRPIFSKAYEINSKKFNEELNKLINETVNEMINFKIKNKTK